MFDYSEQTWQRVSEITKFLKYGFAGATTALSILSLRYETTTKNEDANQRKKLTDAGRWYQLGVLVLAAVTIFSTALGDLAESRLASAADERHRSEMQQALDGQLNKGFKPILDGLSKEVETTSKELSDNLTKQSAQSGQEIQKQERSLRRQIDQSSGMIDKLDKSVAANASRASAAIIEMQSAVLEANLRVRNFKVEISIPPSKESFSRSYDERRSHQELNALTEQTCRLPSDTKGFTGHEEVCKFGTEQSKSWPATHRLAERLFVESGMLTTLHLNQYGLYIGVSASNCGLAFAAPDPIPCLSPIRMTTFERNGPNTSQVDVPFVVTAGEHDRQNGVLIIYNLYDPGGDLLNKKHLRALDLLIREPPLLAVCNTGYSPPPVTDRQIQEIESRLPEWIDLIIEEQQEDEQAGPEEGRVTGFTPWKTHKYTLRRSDPNVRSFCVDAYYVQ
jgi:hypothetical protein